MTQIWMGDNWENTGRWLVKIEVILINFNIAYYNFFDYEMTGSWLGVD